MPFNIAIVGGGITGLTAAALLARAGHRVNVFEAKPGLSEIGAGIALQPMPMKILATVLDEGAIDPYVTRTQGIKIRRYEDLSFLGQIPIATTTLCAVSRYHWLSSLAVPLTKVMQACPSAPRRSAAYTVRSRGQVWSDGTIRSQGIGRRRLRTAGNCLVGRPNKDHCRACGRRRRRPVAPS